jgi:hypothetical protein
MYSTKAKAAAGQALCRAGLSIDLSSIAYIRRINDQIYVFLKNSSERILVTNNDELLRLYSNYVNGPFDEKMECDETQEESPKKVFAMENPLCETPDGHIAADSDQKAADGANSSGLVPPCFMDGNKRIEAWFQAGNPTGRVADHTK